MKTPDLNRWVDPGRDVGILLFAQRLEEAVFHYSADSDKARALNTLTRCLELESATKEVRKEGLPSHILTPMVQELAASLRSDHVARSILGPVGHHLARQDRWDVSSPRAVERQARLVRSKLEGPYEEALVDELRRVLPDGKEKRLICSLVSDLVVCLLHRRFSKEHIYASVRDAFFLGGKAAPRVDGLNSFEDFISRFPHTPRKWDVLLRASPDVKKLRIIVNDICELHDTAPNARTTWAKEKDFLSATHPGPYLLFRGVEAGDARAALARCQGTLRRIASFAALHAHRQEFKTDGQGLVYGDDGRFIVLPTRTAPIHKHAEGRAFQLPSRVRRTAELVTPYIGSGTFDRFVASLKMHETAVRAESNEEQLYALWTALEALLPFEDAESRIGRMVEFLVPLLSWEYPAMLLRTLDQSLTACLGNSWEDELGAYPAGLDRLEKVSNVVAAVDAQPARDRLFALLDDHPLLKFRLFELSEKLLAADRIRDTIKDHERRIEWQLRRVYRTRNSLVHTGRSLPYLEVIVENTHAYLMRVLMIGQFYFGSDPRAIDLDGALLEARVRHESHIDVLVQAGNADTTTADTAALVLGWGRSAT
ncbi:hypothetical protein WI460_03880 [Gemmatimonadota bacterium Y43]|uniref:hypothetical protein n=1 Tax=Gaopeijia maritima TaxID=3119007 RepID=UPI0032796145